eukprot:CAMPEP_0204868064 /NCGR_PEP_ID=MMETSP1348-20121228/25493_1 /ASSEMBLY_ACC=CAM_ASM_000700 /TAXON_ID=215587 /ORGANISM="Aplanochytrium stocchinoi, Strain GSBS06" /LENGTH=718 /DNA_ID=CAMNT_0052020853 /DNA_START=526 /DNA_END=2682 /DNA_ORIENTATION=+
MGAKFVADALKVNNTLATLDLQHNNITEHGLKFLASALESNTSLVRVDVWTTDVEILNQIQQKTEGNKQQKQRLFLETLDSDSKASWNRSRLMFIGQGRAGKSATVRSLLGQPFSEESDSTIGADVSETIATNSIWKKTREPEDFASPFAARIMLEKMAKEKALVKRNNTHPFRSTVVSKIKRTLSRKASRKSFRNEHRDLERTVVNEGENNEKNNNVVNPEIVKEFHDAYFVAAKHDKRSIALSLWDFGGQSVFYSMHHIFMIKSGIYVLVFDMRELLNKQDEALSYISFWLRSIRLHASAAPLVMVGTFLNEISGSDALQTINEILVRHTKTLANHQLVHNDEEDLLFFPVDNKDGLGANGLRKHIEELARKDESVFDQISVRWMSLLDMIISKRNSDSYITFSMVKGLAAKVGLQGSVELDAAMKLFHERGLLIHITATDVLKDIVIIKPQWLIDMLCKVIRDETLHMFDKSEFKKVGLEKDLKLMFSKALASRDLLEYIWKNEKKQVDFFIELMKRTMLLSEYTFQGESKYLIPSLLHDHYSYEELHGEKINGLSCLFDFSESFLPNGVFQRLICLCVASSSRYEQQKNSVRTEPKLFQNFGVIEFQPNCVIRLLEDQRLQRITLYVDNNKKASKCYKVIQSMLRKLNADVMGSGLNWDAKFEDPVSGDYLSHAKAQAAKLSPWFDLARDNEDIPDSLSSAHENVDLAMFLENL